MPETGCMRYSDLQSALKYAKPAILHDLTIMVEDSQGRKHKLEKNVLIKYSSKEIILYLKE